MQKELTNHRWLMLCVHNASSAAELEQAIVDIQCDIFENEPWTKDTAKMNQMRMLCSRKARERKANGR